MINLIMSFVPVQVAPMQPAFVQQADAPMVPAGPLYSEEEAKEMHDMFPSVDLEVIKCVLDEKRGNKEECVNALLQMTQDFEKQPTSTT